MSDDIKDDASYPESSDDKSEDYGTTDANSFLTDADKELAAYQEPFDWDAEEELAKEIEGILGAIEKQDFAENLKLDIRRRMQKAVGKLSKITERQQEKAAKAAKSKAKSAFNKALAVQAMASINSDGPGPDFSGVASSSGAGGASDGDVKGDGAILSIMLQKKVNELQKQIETLEQKARSVTLQWQTDKDRYKDVVAKKDVEREEMALKLAILERKLRFLEQKERDPNMIRTNDEANELKQVKEQLEQLEAELADKKAHLSQVSIELSDTKMELNTAQSRVDVMMKRVEDLLKQEENLHSQIDVLQREKSEANSKIRGLESDIQDLNSRLDHEKENYMVLKNHSMKKEAEFEDKIQLLTSKIEELKKHVNTLWNEKEEQAKEFQFQIDVIQRENAKLILEKEQEVRNQKLLVAQLQQVVRTSNRLMHSLDEQVKSVNNQFNQQDNKFQSLQQELLKLSSSITDILAESDRKVKESEEKLAEQMRIFANSQIKMQSLEEYIEILKKDLKRQEEESAAKIAVLENEKATAHSTINDLKEQMVTLEEELKLERSGPPRYTDEQIAAIRVEAREEERGQWIVEVNKLKDANEEMRLGLVEIQTKLEENQKHMDESHEKEQEALTRCVELETLLDSVNQENDQLKDDLQHALAVAEELEKKLEGSLSARSLASLRSIGVGSEKASLASNSRRPSISAMSRDSSLRSSFSKANSRASSTRSLAAGESVTSSTSAGYGPGIATLVEVPTVDSYDAADMDQQFLKVSQTTPPKRGQRRYSNASDVSGLHGPAEDGAEEDGDFSDGEDSVGSVTSKSSRAGGVGVSKKGKSSKKVSGGSKSSKQRPQVDNDDEGGHDDDDSGHEGDVADAQVDGKESKSTRSGKSKSKKDSQGKVVDAPEPEGDTSGLSDEKKKEISEARAKKQARKNLLKAARIGDADSMDDDELALLDDIPGLNDGAEPEVQEDAQYQSNTTQTEEMQLDLVPIIDLDSVEGIVRQSLQTNNYYFSKETNTFSNAFPIDEAFLRELIRSFYEIGESTVTLINKAQKDTFGIDGEVAAFLLGTAKDLIMKMEKSRDDSLNKLKAEHNDQMAERIEETMTIMNNEKNAALYEQADKFREEMAQMKTKYEDQLQKAVVRIKKIREEHEIEMQKAKAKWAKDASSDEDDDDEEDDDGAPENDTSTTAPMSDDLVAPSRKKDGGPAVNRSRRNAIFKSSKTGGDGATSSKSSKGKMMTPEERERLKQEIEEEVRKKVLAEVAEKQAKVQELVNVANRSSSNQDVDEQLAELWAQLPERFQAKGMDLQAMREELLTGDLSYIGDVRMENFDRLKRDRRFGTDELVALTIIEHTMRYDTGEGGSNPFDISTHNEELTAEQKAAKERQYRMQMKSMEIQKTLLLQKVVAHVPILDLYGYLHATERHLHLLSTLNAWKSLCYYQAGGMFRDVLQVHLEVIEMCIKSAGGINAALQALATADVRMSTDHWPESFRIRALEVFRHQLSAEQLETRQSMERMLKSVQKANMSNFLDHASQHINDSSIRHALGDSATPGPGMLTDKERELQRQKNLEQLNNYMASRSASPVKDARAAQQPIVIPHPASTATDTGNGDDNSVHSDPGKKPRPSLGPPNAMAAGAFQPGPAGGLPIYRTGSRGNARRDSDASDATSMSSMSNHNHHPGPPGIKQNFGRAASMGQRQVSRIAEESHKPPPSLKSLATQPSTFSLEVLEKIANETVNLPESKHFDPNAIQLASDAHGHQKRVKHSTPGGLHYKLDHICFLALRGEVAMYDLLTTLYEGFMEWDACHNIAANNLFQSCLGKSENDYVDDVVSTLIRASIQSEIPQELKEVFEKICHVLDICDTYAESFMNPEIQEQVAKRLMTSITASATSAAAAVKPLSSKSSDSATALPGIEVTKAAQDGIQPETATTTASVLVGGSEAPGVVSLGCDSEEAIEAAAKMVSKAMKHPLSMLFEQRGKSSLSAHASINPIRRQETARTLGTLSSGLGENMSPTPTVAISSNADATSTAATTGSVVATNTNAAASAPIKKSVTTFDCGTQTQFDKLPPVVSKTTTTGSAPSITSTAPTAAAVSIPSTAAVASATTGSVDISDDVSVNSTLTVPVVPVPMVVPAPDSPGPVTAPLPVVAPEPPKASTIIVTKKKKEVVFDEHPYGLPRGFTFAFFKDDEFEICPGVFISSMERVEEAMKAEFIANQIKKQQLLLQQQAEEEKIKQEGETYASLMKKKRKKNKGEKGDKGEEEVDLPTLQLRLEHLPANVKYCYGPNIQSDELFPQGLRPAPVFLDVPTIDGFRALIFPAVFALRPGINLITGFQYLGQGNDHLFTTLNMFKGKNNSQEVITLPKDLLLLQLMSDFIKTHSTDDVDGALVAPLPRGLYRANLSDRILRDPDMFKLRKDIATFENNPELKNAKKTFIKGKAVEVINNSELEIPLGHELVQIQECLIDFPVGVEVSPGVRIAATPANIVLPDNIRLVKKARKTPLPPFMKSLTEATDDEDVNIGAKMNECITIVAKPKEYHFELGMEIVRRPLGHPLPEGMTPVPLTMYPDGLTLPDDLELVQLTPKFDFPPECRLTSAWYVLPRPYKVSLRPNQYIIYPDPNLEDHVIPPLPTYACPISMPYLPHGVILPARSQAVELLLSKLTTFPLPEGAMLAPGITVLHPKILHQNTRVVKGPGGSQSGQINHERKNPAVNVLLVRRTPGTPLPKTVERGSREDLPAGVLLEENMDIVRVCVRFELPPGVKLDVGVQLGPYVQLSPGTQLISSTLTGNRHHAKQLTVLEWPYAVYLEPGIELVARPPKGTYLPFDYIQVNPASRDLLQSLPEDAILVRLPRDLQLLSSLQIAERITVGVESVMEEYHRPLPEGVIFASRQTANIQWPSGISSVPRSSLPAKLVQLMDRINSDTTMARSAVNKDTGGETVEHVKSNLNVEAVQVSPVYEMPAGVEIIEGIKTVEKPFWIQKHSRVAVLRIQDRQRDLHRLAERDIFEVRYRPDVKFMEMKNSSSLFEDLSLSSTSGDGSSQDEDDSASLGSIDVAGGNKTNTIPTIKEGAEERENEPTKEVQKHGGSEETKGGEEPGPEKPMREVLEDVRVRYPLPPDCIIVRLPEVFEVYSWGDALPGIQAVVWDATTSQIALPPGHFLIQRPRNKMQDELPSGFQLGICEHYRQLRVPALPPQLEIMHLLPSRHLPRGVNLINTSVIGRNQFNNFVGQTMMSGGGNGGTYTKKSFQPYWIPQLCPFEPVSQYAVVVPWPTTTNQHFLALEEIDGQIFRDPHALIWSRDPHLGIKAYPGNIIKHPQSDQIIDLLFPEPHTEDGHEVSTQESPFLTALLPPALAHHVKKRTVHLREVLHVVKVANGFPNPRDRFKNPSAASKGSLAPINSDDDTMIVYPRLNRVQRLQLLDPTVEVNKFLAALHVFRFGKDAKEMEMELKQLRFDIMESSLFKALAGSDKATREVDRLKTQLRKSHAANTNMQKALDMIQSEFKEIKDQLQDQDDLKAIIAMLKTKLEEKSQEIQDVLNMRQDTAERLVQQVDVLTSQLAQYRNSGLNPVDDLTTAERIELKKQERKAMEQEVRGYLSKEIAAEMQVVLRRQILSFTNLFTSCLTRLIVNLDQQVFHKYLSSFQMSSIVEEAEKKEMLRAQYGDHSIHGASGVQHLLEDGSNFPRRDSFEDDNQSAISAITEHQQHSQAHPPILASSDSIDGGDGMGSLSVASGPNGGAGIGVGSSSSSVLLPASQQFPYFQPPSMPTVPQRPSIDLTRDPTGKRLPVTPAFPVDVKGLYLGAASMGHAQHQDSSDDEGSSYISFAKSLPPMPRASTLSPSTGHVRHHGFDLASQSQPLNVSKSSDNVVLSRSVGDLLKRRKIQQGNNKRVPERPHPGLKLPRLPDDPVVSSNTSVAGGGSVSSSLNGSPSRKAAAAAIANANPMVASMLMGDEANAFFDAHQSPWIMRQLHTWSEQGVAAVDEEMTQRIGDIEASIFHANVRIQEVLSELLQAGYQQLQQQKAEGTGEGTSSAEQKDGGVEQEAVLVVKSGTDAAVPGTVTFDDSRPLTTKVLTDSLSTTASISSDSLQSQPITTMITLTADSKQWRSIEDSIKQTFQKLYDYSQLFVATQHQAYFHSLTLMETENKFLSRELKSSRQRVDLLQSLVNEQKKQLQSALGAEALETMTTNMGLREKIVSLEAKVDRLLEGQVKEEVKTLQDQINKVVHLNDLDKQFKFSALSLRQIAAKEENKLPKNFVEMTASSKTTPAAAATSSASSEGNSGSVLSENEIKAIRHHCQRLKKQAKSFEERSGLIHQEVTECIAGLLEHMENYQRLVQPVLPPKILTMMLQRSLQYYERLKAGIGGGAPPAATNIANGGHSMIPSSSSVQSQASYLSSSYSTDSASLPFPALNRLQPLDAMTAAGSTLDGDVGSLYDDSDAASQVSQTSYSAFSKRSVGSSSNHNGLFRDSASILTDASKSLHQAKVKFGNIGSIPAAPEKSHLTKRFDPKKGNKL